MSSVVIFKERPPGSERRGEYGTLAGVTTFLGRDADLADIAAALDAHRVVTFTGGRGIGKDAARD